jgi:hypothetical protein
MSELYQASHIKRVRSTKAVVERRRECLYDIIAAMQPTTLRQAHYQATVREIVDKTEAGYNMVQPDLVSTFYSVEQALNDAARLYRKALWADVGAYVEIWLEKDALAGVLMPVTSEYDVPLMVARGYASLSFLHSAGDYIADLDVPTFICHFGDFDPAGVNAGEKIEQTLREMAPKADITFERVAVTPDQRLPTQPTKSSDTRSKGFGDISVELEAIDPERLRLLVWDAIQGYLLPEQFEVLKVAEEAERQLIGGLVAMATTQIQTSGTAPKTHSSGAPSTFVGSDDVVAGILGKRASSNARRRQ